MPGKRSREPTRDLQARIIELIGLTFDQFTRSVLLAQNDFSTFLKAEQGEKASLLEKLTGTEQYSEISRRIFAKNAEAKEAYEQLYARAQDIELLSEGGGGSLPNPPFGLGGGAGPSGEGEGRAAKPAGGRESGRGPDRLEGKTAGGERPFLGTGVGIAGNLKGRSMSKERCDWRGRMRNLRACDWNCNRPGNWTCNWNRP